MKKDTKAEKLANLVKDNAFELAGLAAQGVETAAVELHCVAALTTEWLTYLSRRNPAQFSAIARGKLRWPVMYGRHPEWIKEAGDLVNKLQVGGDININLSSGKTFSWSTPADVIAFNLYRTAEELRRAPRESWRDSELTAIAACGVGLRFLIKVDVHSKKYEKARAHVYDAKYEDDLKALKAWGQRNDVKGLPRFSKQTAKLWWPSIKDLFKIAYPGDFERHPNLQELRISASGRATPKHAKAGRPGDIRKAMLQAVKQAWLSIAAKDIGGKKA